MLTVNNTTEGYIQNLEIKGNTIQNPNSLDDIRSVGDQVEGQELYKIPLLCRGKNLFDGEWLDNTAINITGSQIGKDYVSNGYCATKSYIKVKPNMSLKCNLTKLWVIHYDKNKSYMSNTYTTLGSVNVPSNVEFVRFYAKMEDRDTLNGKIQLEEGTVSTPYEPYIEDKLTILSPTQLEKVGDVADRIIEKDGVWGVEKNIITYTFDGKTKYSFIYNEGGEWIQTGNTKAFYTYFFRDVIYRIDRTYGAVICDKLPSIGSSDIVKTDKVGIGAKGDYLCIRIPNDAISSVGGVGADNWIKDNLPTIKYVTSNPKFIPLPHDQQVKLKTFANKTNISFLTEIEGTIKGEVAKSLGATVNTHTTQIDNLNKELDRVKKLEESTVSTVVTDKDFTAIEETSNGYFEDVKLEGKTDINLSPKFEINYEAQTDYDGYCAIGQSNASTSIANKGYVIKDLKADTEYTIMCNVISSGDSGRYYLNNTSNNSVFDESVSIPSGYKGLFVKKLKSKKTFESNTEVALRCQNANCRGQVTIKDFMILEGDHTQNPQNYFEGLKSVGDGTDKIVVSSIGSDNLFDIYKYVPYYEDSNHIVKRIDNEVILTGKMPPEKEAITITTPQIVKSYVYLEEGKTYDFSFKSDATFGSAQGVDNVEMYWFLDGKLDYIVQILGKRQWTCPKTGKYYPRFDVNKGDATHRFWDIVVRESDIPETNDIEYKSDKKQLLYLDPQDSTWKKPTLREWDTVEKHSDGKYYYHKRSGEVVLNGSEEIYLDKTHTDNLCFRFAQLKTWLINSRLISDKFKNEHNVFDVDKEGIYFTGVLRANILKSKLETQDVAGFKKWLQANNVTVVYQLAEEEIYECTNIDLITYQNQTNYLVESGAIFPKSTLKVHNNISNVVNLLQKKVSILEQNVSNYMITQNRLMLVGRYGADRTDFKVDNTLSQQVSIDIAIDYDLFNLMKSNILVGKQNYSRFKMEEMMDFYVNLGVLDWDLWDELCNLIEEQHTPQVVEEIPLVIK